ncbi:hypothetical protein RHGRI_038850 [Rhododendron griersonianum]|uniref:Uncharacterized protein n=1 Tax=Rhododendron griersonianum TaxID=479676 RepID=A0AAV6HI34_9ERIC|nr:hypothetical protein RHGRI_038850 [Rhododendron griersonianum]
MPPAVPANLNSWFFVGLVFPKVASHYMTSWSPNHQYLVSVLLISGAHSLIVIHSLF